MKAFECFVSRVYWGDCDQGSEEQNGERNVASKSVVHEFLKGNWDRGCSGTFLSGSSTHNK